MPHVLTLLADPAVLPLEAGRVKAAADCLARSGAEVGRPDWLAPGIACDLPFSGLAPGAAEAALRALFAGLPLDLAAQPLPGRRKQLLVADMESTIIRQEMLDELAEAVGQRNEIAAITERAMRGELDFESALTERVARLAGLPLAALAAAAERIELMPGARALVATMKAEGAITALVSGGFTFFTSRVAEACGFDSHQANRLELEGDRLTGRVAGPILGRDAKLAALCGLAAEQGLQPAAVCAVGDGANDLTMLRAAGLGVAFRAKPLVRVTAPVRLDHADLTGLLYLQGYRQAEIRQP